MQGVPLVAHRPSQPLVVRLGSTARYDGFYESGFSRATHTLRQRAKNMSTDTTRNIYDCIVVGSGAAGGWAAQELTAQGLNVLLLEAGPPIDPSKDFRSHEWPPRHPF